MNGEPIPLTQWLLAYKYPRADMKAFTNAFALCAVAPYMTCRGLRCMVRRGKAIYLIV